jgi:transcriptional regulator GlxA family with amidase domain
MVAGRPYRPTRDSAAARAELSRCAGTQFDARVVEALCAAGLGAGFLEHLRPHGDAVTARLASIGRALAEGQRDGARQQAELLLSDAIDAECALRARAERIASVKPATRRELLRRVLLAADFMLGHYREPIRLEQIADAARLSRFHLVRLFHRVQGVTPHEFLLAKRLTVARRLLGQTHCDLAEIAARSGFGTRCSLFRHLHKQLGAGGRRLRSPMPAIEPCRIAA